MFDFCTPQSHVLSKRCQYGGAENAGVENVGVEKIGSDDG